LRAHVELGPADLSTIKQYTQNRAGWTFKADNEGLTLSWGDRNLSLFFAWDNIELGPVTPPPPAPRNMKAEVRYGMGAHDETETLPGLDNDIKRWTNEAQDET
jgi:hypothetical protein